METKKKLVFLPEELFKKLKMRSAQYDISANAIIVEAVQAYFDKYESLKVDVDQQDEPVPLNNESF